MSDSTAQNKALIRRWFDEVWNQGRTEMIDEVLSPDCVIHGLQNEKGESVQGASGFRGFHTLFREAFPDIKVTVEDTVAEGDLIVARCSVSGKHTGNSLGISASNAPIDFDGIAIVRVRDGKFVEAWNSFDFLKMNQQIGII